MAYRRILILGGDCSGRAWLARSVAEITGLRRWDPSAPGADAGRVRAEALAEDAWILEEHAAAPDPQAFERADLVVLLRAPLWLRGLRLARDVLTGARRRRRTPPRPERPHVADAWLDRAGERGVLCRTSEDVRRLLDTVAGVAPPGARR